MNFKKIFAALTIVVTLNLALVSFANYKEQVANPVVATETGAVVNSVVGPMDPPPQ